jgi:hypothetical protein
VATTSVPSSSYSVYATAMEFSLARFDLLIARDMRNNLFKAISAAAQGDASVDEAEFVPVDNVSDHAETEDSSSS